MDLKVIVCLRIHHSANTAPSPRVEIDIPTGRATQRSSRPAKIHAGRATGARGADDGRHRDATSDRRELGLSRIPHTFCRAAHVPGASGRRVLDVIAAFAGITTGCWTHG